MTKSSSRQASGVFRGIPSELSTQFEITWLTERHSYLGEVGIWTGIYVLASTALQGPYFPRGTVALGAVSPLFTWYILTKVSLFIEIDGL
jgi:S-adenosylmethionine hydrolase